MIAEDCLWRGARDYLGDGSGRGVENAMSDSLRTDIFDRQPATCGIDRPAALLGDAAHPMVPNAAQEACQAPEDGAPLGAALTEGQTIESGLVRYERRG